jgi:hypothetical protein
MDKLTASYTLPPDDRMASCNLSGKTELPGFLV